MKRFALPLVVILILAGAAVYFKRHVAPHARQVAAWLPGGTILFEDMPDLHRTEERWPETALAQLIDEPEVQAVLDRPLGEIPRRGELDERLAQIRRIDPLHFFMAVTDWNTSGPPNAIAGLYYSGSREDLDALLDELRKQAQETWPAGKSDVEKYGAGDIETFTTPNFSAALAYRGRWLFIATNTAVLKAALDRFEGQRDPNSLAELPAFKSCLQHLPPASDNLFFLRPALLADKAATLALMLNPTASDAGNPDTLKKIDAVGLSLKLDGEVMRDAAYIIKPETGAGTPLAKDSLKLSSPDTILAVSSLMQPPEDAQLPDPKYDPTGVLQLLASYLKTFNDQGLGAPELAKAFGPESGFLLDWPAGAMVPTPLVMMDVRNRALAHKFLDTLTTLPLAAGVEFTHAEAGGMSIYSLPPTGIGIFPLQVTLGLTDKSVIGAMNMDALKSAAGRMNAQTPGLEGTEAYKKAAALVAEPTTSFTYVDAKAIFGRAYGLFKGVASMGFIPHLSDYVDIGKLPAAETITRHLSPIIASGSVQDGGLLMESAGPVTTTQAGLVAAVAVGAAALPYIEQQIKGQSVTIPGFPGLSPNGLNSGQNPFTSPSSKGGSAPQPPAAPQSAAATPFTLLVHHGHEPPAAPQSAAATPSPSASASGGTP